jgi:hypothetical protein
VAYQCRQMKSIEHSLHCLMKSRSQSNPIPFTPFVTAGEPRYILSLSDFAGSMSCFHAVTAEATEIQDPPAPGLMLHISKPS